MVDIFIPCFFVDNFLPYFIFAQIKKFLAFGMGWQQTREWFLDPFFPVSAASQGTDSTIVTSRESHIIKSLALYH